MDRNNYHLAERSPFYDYLVAKHVAKNVAKWASGLQVQVKAHIFDTLDLSQYSGFTRVKYGVWQ